MQSRKHVIQISQLHSLKYIEHHQVYQQSASLDQRSMPDPMHSVLVRMHCPGDTAGIGADALGAGCLPQLHRPRPCEGAIKETALLLLTSKRIVPAQTSIALLSVNIHIQCVDSDGITFHAGGEVTTWSKGDVLA